MPHHHENPPAHRHGRVQKRIPRPTAPSSRGKAHPKSHSSTHTPDSHFVPEGLPTGGVPYPWCAIGYIETPAFTQGIVVCPLVNGWPDNPPYVIALQSGQTGETGDDGYKPYVGWSAGEDMVNLVWYGRDNWS